MKEPKDCFGPYADMHVYSNFISPFAQNVNSSLRIILQKNLTFVAMKTNLQILAINLITEFFCL